ncbi:endonuclease domain-containing protein [Vibrio sp. Y2-5]|uniref:endonuclease domain-containing protein n=1 Tax=Vibrio TaxID=662 RepID=UPI000C9EA3AD|nr:MULTISPECIES: endonuclease domain-containing protein [Vibrio]MBD0787974.1 endonuclease domain-containing protein [Vibrio sp. Y2-5]PNH97361.1 hypothetical protein C1O24_06420 [Vibrio diazotrophicus]
MNNLFNVPQYKKLRQSLRTSMTEPEKRLWFRIRNNHLGVKFRRQHGIGRYIVDFYCPKKKLIVEIDGDSHFTNSAKESDEIRDECMISLGLKVLRVTNSQVMSDLDSVVDLILSEVGD